MRTPPNPAHKASATPGLQASSGGSAGPCRRASGFPTFRSPLHSGLPNREPSPGPTSQFLRYAPETGTRTCLFVPVFTLN